MERFEDAEPLLERAAQMRPNDSTVQYQLGFVLARMGRPAQALPHFEKALDVKTEIAGVVQHRTEKEPAFSYCENH